MATTVQGWTAIQTYSKQHWNFLDSAKEKGGITWFHGGLCYVAWIIKEVLSFSKWLCCGAHENHPTWPHHSCRAWAWFTCAKKIDSQTLRLHLTCRPNALLGAHTLAIDTATCTCLSLWSLFAARNTSMHILLFGRSHNSGGSVFEAQLASWVAKRRLGLQHIIWLGHLSAAQKL